MLKSILLGLMFIGLALGNIPTAQAAINDCNRLMYRPPAVREHDRYRFPNYGRPAPTERNRKVVRVSGYNKNQPNNPRYPRIN